MFLVAPKILKIVIGLKVTVRSSSLGADENHLRFCVKTKNLKILRVLNLILMLKTSYTQMKVSAHITEDYSENIRNSGWIKLFSHFTQLTALYVPKGPSETVPSK